MKRVFKNLSVVKVGNGYPSEKSKNTHEYEKGAIFSVSFDNSESL
jgi:hypothetical protein